MSSEILDMPFTVDFQYEKGPVGRISIFNEEIVDMLVAGKFRFELGTTIEKSLGEHRGKLVSLCLLTKAHPKPRHDLVDERIGVQPTYIHTVYCIREIMDKQETTIKWFDNVNDARTYYLENVPASMAIWIIEEHTWLPAGDWDKNNHPVEIARINAVDGDDPEWREYQRLRQKFSRIQGDIHG